MKLCSAWLLFWGLRLGLSRREALRTSLGEMLDLIAYHAIANGAKPKFQMTFDEILMLR